MTTETMYKRSPARGPHCLLAVGVTKALVWLCIIQVTSAIFFPSAGEIQPLDPKVCESSTVTFTCTFNTGSMDSIVIDHIVGSETTQNVTDNVIVYNSTVAQYTVYNVTREHHRNTVMCCQGSCQGSTSILPTMLFVKTKRSAPDFIQGDLQPNNYIKSCLGQNVTITCSLTEHNSCPIRFCYNDNACASQSDVRIINDTSSVLIIANIKEKMNVYCKCGDSYVGPAVAAIQPYSKPLAVADPVCEVKNFDESMTCTWNYGMNYSANFYPITTCHVRAPHLSSSWNVCPEFTIDTSSGIMAIYWGQSSAKPNISYSGRLLDFKIGLNSSCGDVSTTSRINTKDIIQWSPPFNLQANTVNSTCIHLQWDTVRPERQKTHRVIATSKWNDTRVVVMENVKEKESAPVEVILCDLNMFTTYSFNVQIMSGDGPWSGQSTVQETTHASRPATAPGLIDGAYQWDPSQCTRPSHHRDVCLYWKPIPDIEKNCEILGYHLDLVSASGDVIQDDVPEDFFTTCIRSLACDKEYRVTIFARGKGVDNSPNSTITIVPLQPDTARLQTSFIAEISNSSVSEDESMTKAVEISFPDHAPTADSITMCWCEKYEGDCRKNVPINCTKTSRSADEIQIYVESPEEYIYGVSLETDYGNTGLQWQDCIYLMNAVPTKDFDRVSVETSGEDYAILVTWSRFTCKSGQPYIARYNIKYCPVETEIEECSDSAKVITVGASHSQWCIADLEHDQLYMVQVQGVAKNGNMTRWSQDVYARAKLHGISHGGVAGISLAGVFVFVLILAFTIAVCRRKYRKHKLQEGTIHMPPIVTENFEYKNSGYTRGTEVDRVSVVDESVTDLKDTDSLDKVKTIMNVTRQISKDSGMGDLLTPPPDGYVLAVNPGEPTIQENPAERKMSGVSPGSLEHFVQPGGRSIQVGFTFENIPNRHHQGLHLNIPNTSMLETNIELQNETNFELQKLRNGNLGATEPKVLDGTENGTLDSAIPNGYSKIAADGHGILNAMKRNSHEENGLRRRNSGENMQKTDSKGSRSGLQRRNADHNDDTRVKQIASKGTCSDSGYTTDNVAQSVSDYVHGCGSQDGGSLTSESRHTGSNIDSTASVMCDNDNSYLRNSSGMGGEFFMPNLKLPPLMAVPTPQSVSEEGNSSSGISDFADQSETFPKIVPSVGTPLQLCAVSLDGSSEAPSVNYVTAAFPSSKQAHVTNDNSQLTTSNVTVTPSLNYVTAVMPDDMSSTSSLDTDLHSSHSQQPWSLNSISQAQSEPLPNMSIPQPVIDDSDFSSSGQNFTDCENSGSFPNLQKMNFAPKISGYVTDTVLKTPDENSCNQITTQQNPLISSGDASGYVTDTVTKAPLHNAPSESPDTRTSYPGSNNGGYVTLPGHKVASLDKKHNSPVLKSEGFDNNRQRLGISYQEPSQNLSNQVANGGYVTMNQVTDTNTQPYTCSTAPDQNLSRQDDVEARSKVNVDSTGYVPWSSVESKAGITDRNMFQTSRPPADACNGYITESDLKHITTPIVNFTGKSDTHSLPTNANVGYITEANMNKMVGKGETMDASIDKLGLAEDNAEFAMSELNGVDDRSPRSRQSSGADSGLESLWHESPSSDRRSVSSDCNLDLHTGQWCKETDDNTERCVISGALSPPDRINTGGYVTDDMTKF